MAVSIVNDASLHCSHLILLFIRSKRGKSAVPYVRGTQMLPAFLFLFLFVCMFVCLFVCLVFMT